MRRSAPRSAFVTSLLCFITALPASGFFSGNIIALRVTSLGEPLSGTAEAIFIDEIGVNGSLIQTPVSIPSSGPAACTLSGNSTLEGQLSMSPNGANVAWACYLAPRGTPDVVNLPVSRAVIVLNANGSLNSPLGMGNAYTVPPRHVHSAVV
jgi:hypothetical protein